MKTVTVIIQARLTSARLPGKVLKSIGNYSVLELIYLRLKKARKVSKIVFAIPDNEMNFPLYHYILENLKADVFRGSENDVLSRYKNCAELFPSDYYVRITADCPFVDPNLLDNLVETALQNNYSYVSNTCPPSFPDGFDIEVFSKELLYYMNNNFFNQNEREHVTFGYLKRKEFLLNEFSYLNILNPIGDYSKYRLTLDNIKDYEVILKISEFYDGNIVDITEKECFNIYQNKNLHLINMNI